MEFNEALLNEFETGIPTPIIRAYVTNVGKYKEGSLVGQWVDFPTNAEKMQEVFKNIGIDNVKYKEVFITDVESYIKGISNVIQEHTPLNEVNYLAEEIQQLHLPDRRVYGVISQEHVHDIGDAIDLTRGLDCFTCYENVANDYDLGHYYVETSGIYDMHGMKNLTNYIDYEKFGQDIRLEQGGSYIDGNYVLQIENMREIYVNLEIPQEYKVDTRADIPKKEENINVIIVEPNKQAKEITMPNTLKDLQQAVGGVIADCSPYSDLGMIINDEGKMLNMDLNRALLNKNGQVQDIVAGTMIIAGVDEQGNYASLTPEQKEKSLQNFKYPEAFIKINDEIKSIKIPELPEKKENSKQQEQQKKSESER